MDQSNNRAKTTDGYRGGETLPGETLTTKDGHKLQYFDGGVPNDPTPDQVKGQWSEVPENPDSTKPEQQPFLPGAKTDGLWTNEFYGGDIKGASQKLDYLKSLGVTVIYFNPVAWAASNHKYDATDYKHLDPMFGEPVYNTPGDPASGMNYELTRIASDRVFTAFAKQARAEGIKLIVDGVFNHVGDDSIYFNRYEKYPEIGAYEFWSKIYDKVNAEGKSQEEAKQEVIDSFTSQINPATGLSTPIRKILISSHGSLMNRWMAPTSMRDGGATIPFLLLMRQPPPLTTMKHCLGTTNGTYKATGI